MATLNPSTAINALSEIIIADIQRGIPSSLPELDPLFAALFTKSQGVTREGIGQDFKVLHTFRDSIGGAFEWAAPGGPQPVQGITHSVRHTVEEYPGHEDMVTPGHVRKTITLAKGKGNMLVPQEFLTAATLGTSVGDPGQEIITGTAENAALAEIQSWYATSSKKEIATIPTGGVSFSSNRGTNDRATIIVSGNSVRNFYNGLMVDIYDTTGATKRNSSPCVIDGVRTLPDDANDSGGYGQIIVQSTATTAENLSTAGVVVTDIIVRKGSISKGPLGPEEWLVTTGSPFGINVATYQQFQSIVKSVSGAFTDPVFNRYAGRFFQAYGMRDFPDTVITSVGVENVYVENSDGLARFERNGKPFMIAVGFEVGESPITFQGKRLALHISSFMPSSSDVTASAPTGGRMWMLKLRNQNVVRYVPPRIAQSKTHPQFNSEIEFLYALGGPNGIFKPYHSNSKSTNMQEAPYFRYVAYCPKFMPGIKLTGLQESL